MSPFDDHQDVKRRLDDRTADAVLSGHAADVEPELAAFALALRAVERPAPAPSAALAALLEDGLVGAVSPSAPRTPAWTRAVTWARAHWSLPLQAGLAGSACLVLLLGGAAADTLPDPVQTAVADVVEAVTPLSVPRPPAPAPAPVVVPAEVEDEDEPGDDRQGRGGERSDGRDDSSDGRSGNADEGSGNRDDRSGNRDDRSSGSGSSDDRSEDRKLPTTRPSAPEDRSDSSGSGSGGSGSSGSGSDGSGSDDKGADRSGSED